MEKLLLVFVIKTLEAVLVDLPTPADPHDPIPLDPTSQDPIPQDTIPQDENSQYPIPQYPMPQDLNETDVEEEQITEDIHPNDGRHIDIFARILELNKRYKEVRDDCMARMEGGQDVSVLKVPYQVLLRRPHLMDTQWLGVCGGCLVTLSHVFTAAHCMTDSTILPKNMRVVAGTTQNDVFWTDMQMEEWRTIKSYYIHRSFNPRNLNNDLALIEVANFHNQVNNPFKRRPSIEPIRILTRSMGWSVKPGDRCMLSGYGRSVAEKRMLMLQKMCLKVISYQQCAWTYDTVYVPPMAFCAGGVAHGPCKGDSGSPLICRGVLTGIVSAGLICGNHPGVFADILSYSVARGAGEPFVQYGGAGCLRPWILFVWLLNILCFLI